MTLPLGSIRLLRVNDFFHLDEDKSLDIKAGLYCVDDVYYLDEVVYRVHNVHHRKQRHDLTFKYVHHLDYWAKEGETNETHT